MKEGRKLDNGGEEARQERCQGVISWLKGEVCCNFLFKEMAENNILQKSRTDKNNKHCLLYMALL